MVSVVDEVIIKQFVDGWHGKCCKCRVLRFEVVDCADVGVSTSEVFNNEVFDVVGRVQLKGVAKCVVFKCR